MSIFWKQFISSFLIIFLVLFLFTFLVIGELKKYDASLTKERLLTAAGLISEAFKPSLPELKPIPAQRRGHVEIQNLVLNLGEKTGVRITVLDQDGRALGDSKKSPRQWENYSDKPEVKEAIQNRIGENKRYSGTIQKQMLYVAVPLRDENGKVNLIIRTALPLNAIQRTLAPIESKVIYLGVVLTVVALLISLAVSKTITKSLQSIINVSEELAKGNLNVNIPIMHSKGEIPKITKALHQMAQKLNELFNQLSREKNQLEAVLSAMGEGVMVISNEGKVTIVNNALKEMFNFKDDPCQKLYWEILRNKEIIRLVEFSLESWTPEIREISSLYPDERCYLANAIPINSPTREIILVMFNITDFKRLEKIKADFIANVSHELRTPLTAIKGYTETLEEGAYENQNDQMHFLRIISRNADRLINIVSDLLVLSEVESRDSSSGENATSDFEDVNISASIKSILEALKSKIGEKLLEVNLSNANGDHKIKANRFLIEQMLINLIDNAVKYTPDGGKIRIGVSSDDSQLRIEVEDTGIGIGKEHLPRIFERFYRVDRTRSRSMGGTGLGLSIVKHIVITHGGKIEVQSEEGKGSKFTIAMPR